jgi:DNA-binding Xre family transcriptional regulator
MKRQASYTWELRDVMAANGMYSASDLQPHLADRGIDLSPVQVWRLVTGKPERLSLHVLAALCDVFQCTPADLITTEAANAVSRRAVGADAPIDLADKIQPKKARIRRES